MPQHWEAIRPFRAQYAPTLYGTRRGDDSRETRSAGLWIAVVKPDCGVSTREAYAGIRPGVPAVPLAERIARPVTEWQTFLKNDFEPHIFAAHPEIAAAKAALLDAGAVYAAMSGSGSAVFGLFDDEEKARSRSLTPFVFPLQ